MDIPDVNASKAFDSFRDLPTGAMIVVGVVLLFLLFKVGKLVSRLLLLAVAAALFYGAYWWHTVK
jgi:hypothetical protein